MPGAVLTPSNLALVGVEFSFLVAISSKYRALWFS